MGRVWFTANAGHVQRTSGLYLAAEPPSGVTSTWGLEEPPTQNHFTHTRSHRQRRQAFYLETRHKEQCQQPRM